MSVKLEKSFPVHRYAINQFSRSPLDASQPVANIYLYGGEPIKYRGNIAFFAGLQVLPEPRLENKDQVFLSFNLSQLHLTIDTLRNEKPIYIVFKEFIDGRKAGYLATGLEPTGEEEASSP